MHLPRAGGGNLTWLVQYSDMLEATYPSARLGSTGFIQAEFRSTASIWPNHVDLPPNFVVQYCTYCILDNVLHG